MDKDATYLVIVVKPALTEQQVKNLIKQISRQSASITIETDPYVHAVAEYHHRRAAGEKLSLRDVAEERGLSYSSLRKHAAKYNP